MPENRQKRLGRRRKRPPISQKMRLCYGSQKAGQSAERAEKPLQSGPPLNARQDLCICKGSEAPRDRRIARVAFDARDKAPFPPLSFWFGAVRLPRGFGLNLVVAESGSDLKWRDRGVRPSGAAPRQRVERKGLGVSAQAAVFRTRRTEKPPAPGPRPLSHPGMKGQDRLCFCGSSRKRAHLFTSDARPAKERVVSVCGRGGIGRRAALRSLWGSTPWKFESSRPHQA